VAGFDRASPTAAVTEADLIRRITSVLRMAHGRIASTRGELGWASAATAAATSRSLGSHFNAVSSDPDRHRSRRLLLESLVRPAWGPWRKRAAARAARELEGKLGIASAHCRLGWKVRALTRWSEAAAEANDMRDKLAKCAAFAFNYSAGTALSTWQHNAMLSADDRELSFKAARWAQHHATATAVSRWLERVDEAKHVGWAVRRALRCFARRATRRALRQWLEYTESAVDAKEKISRAVKRFDHTVGLFDCWTRSIVDSHC